jgi:hypothetical protein
MRPSGQYLPTMWMQPLNLCPIVEPRMYHRTMGQDQFGIEQPFLDADQDPNAIFFGPSQPYGGFMPARGKIPRPREPSTNISASTTLSPSSSKRRRSAEADSPRKRHVPFARRFDGDDRHYGFWVDSDDEASDDNTSLRWASIASPDSASDAARQVSKLLKQSTGAAAGHVARASTATSKVSGESKYKNRGKQPALCDHTSLHEPYDNCDEPPSPVTDDDRMSHEIHFQPTITKPWEARPVEADFLGVPNQYYATRREFTAYQEEAELAIAALRREVQELKAQLVMLMEQREV